ncbi:hypothetical protein GGQ74_002377 [Desulfobaculum xiamenense]|uniref:Uncharacterized protein n=1 Tax=Desulfobaculum xiamenense TaxID=995050 RepID=A0A846QU75_9BACT|nr:symporter small accessory protein [Desulfobaculum xiamenense]NJB68704.1 hypothetical protein [Desulfobaculum xiamenense]
MLGFDNPEVALAMWLTLASAVACVVYGIVNWNRGGNDAEGVGGRSDGGPEK